MIGPTVESVVGIAVVLLTLRDVFDTMVVPGESNGLLRILRRLLSALLSLWKTAAREARGVHQLRAFRADGGLRELDAPSIARLRSGGAWSGRLFLADGSKLCPGSIHRGSSLAAIGPSGIQAFGPARWVIVSSGFCGLAVLTMAATYLIQMQQGISGRDSTVLKITTTAGEPPSAIGLLERYAALGCRDDLHGVLCWARGGAAPFCRATSHPSLIYFRSVGVGAGWPATLGAMMNLALIFELLVDEPASRGAAVLLRQEGLRLLDEINAPRSNAFFCICSSAERQSVNVRRTLRAACLRKLSDSKNRASE